MNNNYRIEISFEDKGFLNPLAENQMSQGTGSLDGGDPLAGTTYVGNGANGNVVTKATAISTAYNLIRTGSNSIEMVTGNSVAQRQINDMFGAAALGVALYHNPLLGGLALAVSTVTKGLQNKYQTTWQNKEAEKMRRYSGNYLSTSER